MQVVLIHLCLVTLLVTMIVLAPGSDICSLGSVVYRGYSNVFVKFVHFTSEIKDIFN